MSTSVPDPEITRAAIEATRLYGIVDLGYVAREEVVAATSQLIEGGVGVIQLRAKQSPESEILAMAHELKPVCRAAGVPFVVNDFSEIACSLASPLIVLSRLRLLPRKEPIISDSGQSSRRRLSPSTHPSVPITSLRFTGVLTFPSSASVALKSKIYPNSSRMEHGAP